jgi:hypothetical protein
MDETPPWFNQLIKTVDFVGAKEVPLTHNEPNNRRRITTILAAKELKQILNPCVIYKSESKQERENPDSTAHYIEGVRCYKQQNNTMSPSINQQLIVIVLCQSKVGNLSNLSATCNVGNLSNLSAMRGLDPRGVPCTSCRKFI